MRKTVLAGLSVLALAAVGCGGGYDHTSRAQRLNDSCFRGGEPTNFDFRSEKIVVTCARRDSSVYQVVTDADGFGASGGDG